MGVGYPLGYRMGVIAMRVGIYARVSTADRDQNPETQLVALREFVVAQGWEMTGEFVDKASATDMRSRHSWRKLLDEASRRRLDLIVVFRIDRAFRSVLDAATTLERLRGWRIGLRSYCEPWLDTTSPFGEALYYITAAYAQLERGILAERVRAGMERARKEGKHVGRPPAVKGEWEQLRSMVESGAVSRSQAARILGVSRSTVGRLLSHKGDGSQPSETRGNTGDS
jgi:DNA invertase Pin-like site-specific DNA recombinase